MDLPPPPPPTLLQSYSHEQKTAFDIETIGAGDPNAVHPGVHDAEVSLGPPVGADAAVMRLSETISLQLPDECEDWVVMLRPASLHSSCLKTYYTADESRSSKFCLYAV